MKISVITKLLVIIPAAVLISSEKILPAESPPEPSPLNKNTAAALARELVAQGNAKRAVYNQAAKKIREAERELKLLEGIIRTTEKFFSKVHPDDIDALPGVAAEARKQTTALQSAMESIRNAAAETAAAQVVCEQAENRACDYAKRSTAATEADVKTWQSEATSLISEASKKNQETQAKVKAFQEASDNLQVALNALESYVDAMRALNNAPDENGALGNFQETWAMARDAAKEARDSVTAGNTAAGNVRQICQRIRRTLRPFAYRSSDTALLNQADELERDMTDLQFPDSEEIIQGARRRLDEFTAAVKKIETLAEKSGANAALNEARQAAGAAAPTRSSLAGLTNNSQATAALARASKCLAEIQFKPSAADEVIVPDLSVFDKLSEMKAALAHHDLVSALVAAKENAPTKEKEFKFAGQDPAPHTRVKRGSTVAIAFYQKFEGTETTTEDPNDIAGHWVGTVSWGKSTDPLAIDIRREGNGYVLTSKTTGSKPVPATYAGGKLTTVSQGTLKSKGVVEATFSVNIELTREGETLSGTLILVAANGSAGAPARVVLTRQSK